MLLCAHALAPYNMGAHVPGFVRICSAEWVQWLSAYFSNSLSPLAQPPTWVALVQAGWGARGPRASSVPSRIHPPPAVDQEHSKMTINSICIILSNICLDFSSLLFIIVLKQFGAAQKKFNFWPKYSLCWFKKGSY